MALSISLRAFLFFVTPVIFLLPAIAARVVVPNLDDPEQCYVAICGQLLPPGMMGLMIASMFAATSSALNSEFNVMAGVLTNDLYKRMLAPLSSDRAQFRFARIMTVVIGASITTGAVFVGYFGGAFEANKLFTGIFVVPLATPLLFGMLTRRPGSSAALVVVFGGAVLALTLNINSWFAWEISTLITIVACFSVFVIPGFIYPTRQKEVETFFTQLSTSLSTDDIPRIDAGFVVALKKLFRFSLWISGGLFAAVSMLAIGNISGQLALVAAVLCFAMGACFRSVVNR